MLKKIQNTFTLTDQGVKDFFRGAGCCALANIMLMLPIVVLYLITQDFVAHLSNTNKFANAVSLCNWHYCSFDCDFRHANVAI